MVVDLMVDRVVMVIPVMVALPVVLMVALPADLMAVQAMVALPVFLVVPMVDPPDSVAPDMVANLANRLVPIIKNIFS